jgi:hypothetical protein
VPVKPVPQRTKQQRSIALKEANRIRTERAHLKKRMKAKKEDYLGLLLEPPQYIDTMKVTDFLLAIPKYGKVKTKKVLQLSKISPTKTVGGMSARQRTELVWRMNGGSGHHH